MSSTKGSASYKRSGGKGGGGNVMMEKLRARREAAEKVLADDGLAGSPRFSQAPRTFADWVQKVDAKTNGLGLERITDSLRPWSKPSGKGQGSKDGKGKGKVKENRAIKCSGVGYKFPTNRAPGSHDSGPTTGGCSGNRADEPTDIALSTKTIQVEAEDLNSCPTWPRQSDHWGRWT